MAVVEYDGTAYYGFQVQVDGPTIQAALEQALTAVTQAETRVVAAGRTDTGVHALGQVIHFDTEWPPLVAQDLNNAAVPMNARPHPVKVLQRALNAVLPRDIVIRDLQVAPEGFHARFDARSRVYRYTIFNRASRAPLWERYSWHVPEPLDVQQMAVAAQTLIGTHDFAAFGRPMRAGATTVRTVSRLDCRQAGELITIEIEADAFLRRMVRRIVAGLVEVGLGKLAPEALADILASKNPQRIKTLARPCGLCLLQVNYSWSGSN